MDNIFEISETALTVTADQFHISFSFSQAVETV